jgi:predicted GNAT family N-acyltransferase
MDRVQFGGSVHRAGALALDPLFDTLATRAPFAGQDLRRATEAELAAALALARQTLPVTDAATSLAIQQHNADCFLIVPHDDLARAAMIALLPLNDDGAAALIDGRLDGLAPSTGHVAQEGQLVAALYIWLIWTPGRMNSGLALIAEAARRYPGVAVFTRPVNRASARILDRVGFRPATALFPGAPAALVVALPAAAPRSATITVRAVAGVDDLFKVFAVRTATYMTEQLCSYGEEFDGNDFCATHLLGEIDGEPAGCLRIRWFADFAKLERLAIRPEHRRSRLMPMLVRAAFAHCRRKGYRRLYAHAREDLVPAWQRFGARPIDGRQAFTFSDVRFREMVLEFDPTDDAIGFGCDPLVTIRPEGAWDALGPVERAQLRPADTRAADMAARFRQFRSS